MKTKIHDQFEIPGYMDNTKHTCLYERLKIITKYHYHVYTNYQRNNQSSKGLRQRIRMFGQTATYPYNIRNTFL